MSKIFHEIFNDERKKVFSKLAAFSDDGYLAGGTALALQLGHRVSVDFDVFTYKPLTTRIRSAIAKRFSLQQVHVNSSDQYTFTTSGNVEVTFVSFDYPLIGPLVPTPSISLASKPDIAANKANTLGLRAVWRDYVDLFWLMKEESISIDEIIVWAKQKHSTEFAEAQFLEQLVYFTDLTVTPIQFLRKRYSTDNIQSFLQNVVGSYLDTKKRELR